MSVARADEFMRSLGVPETYRVGGSVRDQVLALQPKDGDYVVRGLGLDALRDAVSAAGAAPRPLRLRDGRQIGVRADLAGLGLVEIALPRKEVSTGPGHRDFQIVVRPGLTLEEDAERRDFTTNALYLNIHTGCLVDPLGTGVLDTYGLLLRTTHPDSFRDDPLRILRGLRLIATHAYRFDTSTLQQLHQHATAVDGLTGSGVSGTALEELSRLLMGQLAARALRCARDTGVLVNLLPELAAMIGFDQQSAYHDLSCDEHTFEAILAASWLDAPLRVRLALLFHDAGKPWMAWGDTDGRLHYYALTPVQAREIGAPPTAVFSHEWWGSFLAARALERLGAPTALRRDVTTLIDRHMLALRRPRAIKLRTWRSELGDSLLSDLILHRRCDVLGKGGDVNDALATLAALDAQHQADVDARVPMRVRDLAVNGDDLMALGLRGPEVGDALRRLLHEVMAKPSLNDRRWLLAHAR